MSINITSLRNERVAPAEFIVFVKEAIQKTNPVLFERIDDYLVTEITTLAFFSNFLIEKEVDIIYDTCDRLYLADENHTPYMLFNEVLNFLQFSYKKDIEFDEEVCGGVLICYFYIIKNNEKIIIDKQDMEVLINFIIKEIEKELKNKK